MTINSVDISLLCLPVMGVGLFASYLGFAYLVSHTGDFYARRRWKAALCVAGISSVFLPGFLFVVSFLALLDESPGLTLFELILLSSRLVIFILVLGIVPILFMITVGVYIQLESWLDSDDYLDKIWADPNKGHRSPIQEL